MDKKIVALLVLSLLVTPAFALSLDDILDWITHPGILIKAIAQLLGLEESTKDKLAAPYATEITPDQKANVELFNGFGELSAEYLLGQDVGSHIGRDVDETIYIGYVENDELYADWTIIVKDGVVTKSQKGRAYWTSPTLYVRVDYVAVQRLASLEEGDDAFVVLRNLYLDGHAEIEPLDKITEYAGDM